MALTDTRPDTAQTPGGGADESTERTQPTAVEKVLGSGDHKTIGRIFIGASLLFVACDLVLTALVNFHFASGDLLEASVANRFGLNHPLALLLCGAMPLVLGLAIYLVPLQIGSPTLAFPRAAAMSLWTWLIATALFTIAALVKGSYGGSSVKLTRLGHVSVGLLCISLTVGVMCVMVTVVSHRVAGMTISRVPFFSFSMLVTGAVWLLTLPVVVAIVTVWQVRRPSPSDLQAGAFPAIEWLFHQPAVYLAAIPLLGLLADACSSAAGQRQKAYTAVQGMIVAFGTLSVGAYAQVPAARQTLVWSFDAVVVALPVLVALGASADTLRRGKFKPAPGPILALSSMLLLLLATASGALQGIVTLGHGQLFDLAQGGFVDATANPTVAVGGPGVAVGQFYFVIAAVVIGGIGATFHWGDRLWRGGLPSGAGLALAPLGLLGGLAFGAGHVIMGIATPDADASEALAVVSAVGASLLAVTALVAFATIVGAAVMSRNADADASIEPATGGTFEWLAESPPIDGNFADDLPAVESEYPLFDARESGAQ